MKKTGILFLMICLLLGNVSFADDGGDTSNIPLSDFPKDQVLFQLSRNDLSDIKEIEYDQENNLIYTIWKDEPYQEVYSLSGEQDFDPKYRTETEYRRLDLEIAGDEALSLDLSSEGSIYLYDGSSYREILGEEDVDRIEDEDEDELRRINFKTNGNQLALRLDCSGDVFAFYSMDDLSTEASIVFTATDYWIKGYDYTPDGTEFIFAGHNGDEDINRVTKLDTTNYEILERFELINPAVVAEDDQEDPSLEVFDLYVDEYIYVLVKAYDYDCSYVQRYTIDGRFVDEVKVNHCVKRMVQGSAGSTLYVRYNNDDEILEVMKVTWENDESTGRPTSVISERSFGGRTIAEFKDNGFGLFKVVDPETGVIDYRAPLKSDANDVRLRIPFADIQAKAATGANNLLISYQGQEIKIPMSVFDCADFLAGMPCQDDATIEIHLVVDESGNVTVTVQLFVVEQVNTMTKVIHRKTIQY
jgi:hypothetical protein